MNNDWKQNWLDGLKSRLEQKEGLWELEGGTIDIKESEWQKAKWIEENEHPLRGQWDTSK